MTQETPPSPNDRPVSVENLVEERISRDPLLAPYREALSRRLALVEETRARLTGGERSLPDFASGHEYFGLHFRDGQGIFREWAPNASTIFLKGTFSDWKTRDRFTLKPGNGPGVWEIFLPGDALSHGDLYCLEMHWPGGSGDRIPAWTRRVVQDPATKIFSAQVWRPGTPYTFRNPRPAPAGGEPLLIYEAHVGMAQEEGKIGSYLEFAEKVLPRVKEAGYNAVQLMAVAEHPYYGSFGYQVSSFFACSSRFGTPEELKSLVDAAHGVGILVLMDLVHSHAVKNEVEGLSRFDGTPYQYFHEGLRGVHANWDSRLFDYGKPEVLHFLLSNCRFWLDEYGFDGFRFDGVTSMLYTHHGLGRAFTGYGDYFNSAVDEEALAYLALANQVVHEVNPAALTIAEDVSGMPGLAAPLEQGGNGFDFRFAMGVPDYWIKLTKDTPDPAWPLGHLYYELTNRRRDEKTVSYAESHDQALVGDQTLIFRLAGERMYEKMSVLSQDLAVSRALALHKMIRLATLSTAGHGYLNFMGNEFGHPEWIDFPREGNAWSFHYARRQWHLMDDPLLHYRHLALFDRAMIALARGHGFPDGRDPYLLHLSEGDKILAFLRAGLVFVLNFNPERSFTDYRIPAAPGSWATVLDSDDPAFGGHGLRDRSITHHTLTDDIHRHFLSLYLPARTALVLKS